MSGPCWLTIRNTCMLGWLLCVYWAHLQLSFLSALASSSRALAWSISEFREEAVVSSSGDFHRRTASPTWKPLFVVLANVASTCAIPIGSGRSCQSLSERRRKRPRADSDQSIYFDALEAENDTPYFLQGSEPPPREQWEIAKPIDFSNVQGVLQIQGRPPPRLQKVCRFQVPKTNPLDMARCCSYSNRKIRKCGNTSPVHCQSWRVQRCNFFRVGNRIYIVSYSHFKSCTFAP